MALESKKTFANTLKTGRAHREPTFSWVGQCRDELHIWTDLIWKTGESSKECLGEFSGENHCKRQAGVSHAPRDLLEKFDIGTQRQTSWNLLLYCATCSSGASPVRLPPVNPDSRERNSHQAIDLGTLRLPRSGGCFSPDVLRTHRPTGIRAFPCWLPLATAEVSAMISGNIKYGFRGT